MFAWLRAWSWPEWRAHPWRSALALFAVAIGVALGFAVHLINASALAEFGAAVRSVNGQPDVELRGAGFDEALYARVAAHPAVRLASPRVELQTLAFAADGTRVPLTLVGLDALTAAPLTPALLPQADAAARDSRDAALDPDAVFVNAALRAAVGDSSTHLVLASGASRVTLRIAGRIAAEGMPMAVIDIAGAQAHFGRLGKLTGLDLRLAPGADRAALLRELALPAGVRVAEPDESLQRVSNLSRAYRVNLTVLALVALFVGGFLVFSVLSLSVAQRLPQLALLGVLGMTARERRALVLGEAALLGGAGSLLGLLLGGALASAALRLLGGDLGSGLLGNGDDGGPALSFGAPAAALYGALGIAAALAGAWQPAHAARGIAPAQALKGLGTGATHALPLWAGPALLVLGAVLALAPPIGGLPWAAYAAVACLLLGGIVCVPATVGALLARVRPRRRALPLLAVERVRDQRHAATIAVAGVVASLALAVALTVMVASFRDAVTGWLERVLPADLYARTATSSASADSVFLPREVLDRAAALPGVERVEASRFVPLSLDAARPSVTLIARPLHGGAALPLIGDVVPAPPDATAVYASEAAAALYGARPGTRIALPLPDGGRIDAFVAGTWRDYARQHGAIAIDSAAFTSLTGDTRANDLALWLRDGANVGDVQRALRELAGPALEFSTPAELRMRSLAIFDRSFAVTRWLQAVAIGIGLAGIAASFSAQVLARRREFGLLAHLGVTRREVLALVAAEGALWSAAGVVLGLLLGLAVSVVLVHVVNPQSFHWTMELRVPGARLAALAAAVLAAGTLTALVAARSAAGRDAVRAVKEDW
jgi:putative ABC transport system permease protein